VPVCLARAISCILFLLCRSLLAQQVRRRGVDRVFQLRRRCAQMLPLDR
jgi:hypothetical protein